MSIFGFEQPAPTNASPAEKPAPVKLADLRAAIDAIDAVLHHSNRRQTYSSVEIQDLLLDVRVYLDRLTSPTVLLKLTKELYLDAKQQHDEITGRADAPSE